MCERTCVDGWVSISVSIAVCVYVVHRCLCLYFVCVCVGGGGGGLFRGATLVFIFSSFLNDQAGRGGEGEKGV